jgi:hypothetical protein
MRNSMTVMMVMRQTLTNFGVSPFHVEVVVDQPTDFIRTHDAHHAREAPAERHPELVGSREPCLVPPRPLGGPGWIALAGRTAAREQEGVDEPPCGGRGDVHRERGEHEGRLQAALAELVREDRDEPVGVVEPEDDVSPVAEVAVVVGLGGGVSPPGRER